MNAALVVAALLVSFNIAAGSGAYGEGYSARAPGVASEVYWRAFSLGNMEEICSASAVPSEFRARPVTLRIGDRLHRNADSGVVIEAYDARNGFLPHVPIRIELIDPSNVVRPGFWEDGDYLIAERQGEAKFHVSWACGAPDRLPVEFAIPIIVVSK